MNKQIIIDSVDVSKCEFYDKDKGYCLTLKMNPKGFKNPSCFSGDFQECIQENKICPNTFCHNNPNCYYKQLKHKNAEYNKIAVLLRDTDIYSQVCETCRDEILIYPSISGKTNYTDNEVDIITLRRIINRLKNKEQKCKELEQEINHLKEQGSILLADKNAFQIGYDTSKARVKELEEILDEIEKELKEDIYCESQECGCDDFEECLRCTKEHILDIINKVKGW